MKPGTSKIGKIRDWFPANSDKISKAGNQHLVMDVEKRENDRGKILLACTGSVASIKIPLIVDELLKLKVSNSLLST